MPAARILKLITGNQRHVSRHDLVSAVRSFPPFDRSVERWGYDRSRLAPVAMRIADVVGDGANCGQIEVDQMRDPRPAGGQLNVDVRARTGGRDDRDRTRGSDRP